MDCRPRCGYHLFKYWCLNWPWGICGYPPCTQLPKRGGLRWFYASTPFYGVAPLNSSLFCRRICGSLYITWVATTREDLARRAGRSCCNRRSYCEGARCLRYSRLARYEPDSIITYLDPRRANPTASFALAHETSGATVTEKLVRRLIDAALCASPSRRVGSSGARRSSCGVIHSGS